MSNCWRLEMSLVPCGKVMQNAEGDIIQVTFTSTVVDTNGISTKEAIITSS